MSDPLAEFWTEVAKQQASVPLVEPVTDQDVDAFLFALDVWLGVREQPLPAEDARLLGKAAGRMWDLWKRGKK